MRSHVLSIVSTVLLSLMVAGCGPSGGGPVPISSLPLENVDYAAARASFETKLVVQKPAPQPFHNGAPPAGVDEVPVRSGDLTIRAWVGRPAAAQGPSPAVIFLHGGYAFAGVDFSDAAPYMDAGYVLVAPMLRGENGNPGSFSMFFHEVDDVLAVLEYVKTLPYVDPERIFVSGHSVGGTLAMLAGMATGEFKAVASIAGSPDQKIWARRGVPFDANDPREFTIRSPIAYATSMKSPARLYFGDREPFFKKTTFQMAERAQLAGLDVAAEIVPGNHGSAVAPAVARSIKFFDAQP